MRAVPWLAMAILTACEPIEPSGSPFAPVAPAPAAAPTASEPSVAEPAVGFDFDADAAPEAEAPADATLEPVEVAAGLGLGVAAVAAPSPGPVIPEVAPPPPSPPEPAGWTPGAPLEGSWGVRLVSTVPDAQPPRAILGLPGGQEVVVSPGTLLPDARVVVLAIGRDAVQIAEITPAGDHARVETRVIEPMFRQAPSPR